jgi:HSP20 family protein
MSKQETKLLPTEKSNKMPPFVEFETLLEKVENITKDIAARAYDFFMERGSLFGNHMEDWFRAESELLRTAPAKILEAGDKVTVMIAAPGFKSEEIEVSVKDNFLIVSGEANMDEKREDDTTFYDEWTSSRFFRKLRLPANIDSESVDATLKDGVLTLLMKKKAAIGESKIAVKAA